LYLVAALKRSNERLAAPLQRVALPTERTRSRTVRVYLADTKALVTAIGILSPANKRGRGLQQYRQKREALLFSDCHLVELDLVRRGERPGWELEALPLATTYVCLVNRARDDELRISNIWPLKLADPLPTIPIPLLPPDPDVALDLTTAMQHIYARARYARRLDYRTDPPRPPCPPMRLAGSIPACGNAGCASSSSSFSVSPSHKRYKRSNERLDVVSCP
jgi:hypothetical protein